MPRATPRSNQLDFSAEYPIDAHLRDKLEAHICSMQLSNRYPCNLALTSLHAPQHSLINTKFAGQTCELP
eukprot:1161960-Pelagomonas_calceolata.AAC.11